MGGLTVLAARRSFEFAFRERHRETPTVTTFHFSTEGSGFEYRSNQSIRLQIPGVVDPWGPARLFSLSSSPTEVDRLSVTTKMTGSAFKNRLESLEPGERVQVYGPLGHLLYDPTRPAVMLAGGIGITPLRGMIRFAADQHVLRPIVLLYSARTPEELAFRREFDSLRSSRATFHPHYTITQPRDSTTEAWRGRVGRIDAKWIRESAAGLDWPKYYVVGLPAFLTRMLELLTGELGVPREEVVFEPFHGF